MSTYVNKVANTNTPNVVPVQGTFDQYGTNLSLVGPGGIQFNGPEFVPPTNDYAGILAAYNAAVANGGGIVQFLPVTYNIGANTIPLANNVKYVGSGWHPYFVNNIVDDSFVYPNSGTIINGTSIGFGWNTTDLSAIPSGNYNNLSLTNSGISDVAIQGCTYGVKIGALYNLGAAYCEFKNIATFGCTIYGQWYENCIHVVYNQLVSINCGISASSTIDGGGITFASSINGYGNSSANDITVTANPNLLTRCLEVRVRDPLALNTTLIGGLAVGNKLQGNRFNNPTFTPQTCVGNGTTSLQVTDSSKFAVGLPVVFQSGSAFISQIVYSVDAIIDATHIRLVDQPGGTAQTYGVATGTILQAGFPCISAVAEQSNCNVGFGVFESIDAEAGGTTKLYANRIYSSQPINVAGINRDNLSYIDVCLRQSSAIISTPYSNLIMDIDSTSSSRSLIMGLGFTVSNTTTNIYSPTSLFFQNPNTEGSVASININNLPVGRGPSFTAQIPSPYNADWIRPGPPLGVSQGYSATGTSTVDLQSGTQGWGVYTGTGAATWTFNAGLNSRVKGFRQTFKNKGTGALTITLGASDGTFDGMTGGLSSGKSVLLAAPSSTTAGGSITIICCQIGTSTYQWEIESLNLATLV